MTRFMVHDLSCSCGRHFRRPLFHSLTATRTPGLRYAVLAGVFNTVQCPSCERIARVNLAFLYQDPAHNRLVYVYPLDALDSENNTEAVGQMQVHLSDSLGIIPQEAEELPEPVVIFGMDQLAELIGEDMPGGEYLGSVFFDARPGARSEQAARAVAARVAADAGGYVHSWREGGRLHLQVVASGKTLQEMTSDESPESE